MRHQSRSRWFVVTLAFAGLNVVGCAGSDGVVAPRTLEPSAPSLSNGQSSSTVRVVAGGSIQQAINAAGAGGTILIEPGVYAESLVVTARNVHIKGLNGSHGAGVVLTNPGTANNGIRVPSTATGFELENLTVRGFARNGVILIGVDGFTLSAVTTQNNGEYGLFPVRSSHGVIDNCSASGHADTGIYVGQSSDVEIRNSLAFGNVAGFEIENSTRVTLSHSEARGNTVGVLVSLVPGLPIMTATNNLISHNDIHDNNLPNFGDPEDLAGLLPSGSGIIIIGPDHVTVEHNKVTGNNSTGIAVASALLLAAIAGLPPEVYDGVDPNSDYAEIQHNDVTGNGTAPQPPLAGLLPGVDLLWDGSGVGNCWGKNHFRTSYPSPLPACK